MPAPISLNAASAHGGELTVRNNPESLESSQQFPSVDGGSNAGLPERHVHVLYLRVQLTISSKESPQEAAVSIAAATLSVFLALSKKPSEKQTSFYIDEMRVSMAGCKDALENVKLFEQGLSQVKQSMLEHGVSEADTQNTIDTVQNA